MEARTGLATRVSEKRKVKWRKNTAIRETLTMASLPQKRASSGLGEGRIKKVVPPYRDMLTRNRVKTW